MSTGKPNIQEFSQTTSNAPGPLQIAKPRARVHREGCADLLFDEPGSIYISGTAARSRMLDHRFGGALRGFRLKPGAVPFFFGVPASVLANQVTSIADLSSPFARTLTLTARESDSQEALLQTICKLLSQACSGSTRDRRLQFVVSQIRKMTIPSLAFALGITERQLHRVFMQEAGVSPSRPRRIHRLQRVIDDQGPFGRNVSGDILARLGLLRSGTHESRLGGFDRHDAKRPLSQRLARLSPNATRRRGPQRRSWS